MPRKLNQPRSAMGAVLKVRIMKLKTLNHLDYKNSNARACRIFIYADGKIILNKALCEKMRLIKGDKLGVSYDIESDKDYYLFATNNGFSLKQNSSDGGLYISSRKLSTEIFDKMGFGIITSRVTYLVAEEATIDDDISYFAVLTRKPASVKEYKS